MRLALYAIIDILTGEILNGIAVMHRHPTAAIRMFDDTLRNDRTQPGQHPKDFNLVELGYQLDDPDGNPLATQFVATNETIMTGAAWLAMQQTEPKLVQEAK